MNFLQVLSVFLASTLGTPYYWGGNNPVQGYDCSGFVMDYMAMYGIGPKEDSSAQMIFNYFQKDANTKVENYYPGLGALVFYGTRVKVSGSWRVKNITHIGVMINENQIAEAGGGDRRTLTMDEAAEQNAYVRIRPYNRRKDIVFILTPKYPKWSNFEPSYRKDIEMNWDPETMTFRMPYFN